MLGRVCCSSLTYLPHNSAGHIGVVIIKWRGLGSSGRSLFLSSGLLGGTRRDDFVMHRLIEPLH